MTVIRLLNKESYVATKKEGKNIARDTDRRTAEATASPTKSKNDRITVVVGDSIITVKAGQAYPPRFYSWIDYLKNKSVSSSRNWSQIQFGILYA